MNIMRLFDQVYRFILLVTFTSYVIVGVNRSFARDTKTEKYALYLQSDDRLMFHEGKFPEFLHKSGYRSTFIDSMYFLEDNYRLMSSGMHKGADGKYIAKEQRFSTALDKTLETMEHYPNPPLKFNKRNFEKSVLNLRDKISEGKIGSGSQILVVINAHGLEAKPSGETTHAVVKDGIDENGEKFSLDSLVELRNAADKHGVKLAIIDMSCFSGATQKLASANTCVISGSGSRESALFGNIFYIADHIKTGVSLEDQFLEWFPHFMNYIPIGETPRISTPAGLKASRLFEDLREWEIITDQIKGRSPYDTGCYQDLPVLDAQKALRNLQNVAMLSDDVFLDYTKELREHLQSMKDLRNLTNFGNISDVLGLGTIPRKVYDKAQDTHEKLVSKQHDLYKGIYMHYRETDKSKNACAAFIP